MAIMMVTDDVYVVECPDPRSDDDGDSDDDDVHVVQVWDIRSHKT